MTFSIIRIVLAAVTFAAGAFIIKKIRTPDAAVARIFLIVLIMAQTSILCLFPVENGLFSFESAEKSYRYSNPGNVRAVVEGEDSGMVIGEDDDTLIYSVIPKTEDGWKICVGADVKRVFYNYSDGIKVEIYQHRKIDDFYVCVTDTNGEASEIKDNVNSEFLSVASGYSTAFKTVFYYAFINAESGSYEVTLNGETVAQLDSLGGWFYDGRKVNRG